MRSGSVQNSAFQQYASTVGATDSNVVALPGSGARAVLPGHSAAEWGDALTSRLNELTSLPKGWDGYAGRPVLFTTARFAAELLERLYDAAVAPPSLVPGSDGTLQIEWHANQYDIEIDVLGPYKVQASRFDHLAGVDEDLDLEADVTPLAQWISDLAADRSALAVVA